MKGVFLQMKNHDGEHGRDNTYGESNSLWNLVRRTRV
jgi:hypothetical protein